MDKYSLIFSYKGNVMRIMRKLSNYTKVLYVVLTIITILLFVFSLLIRYLCHLNIVSDYFMSLSSGVLASEVVTYYFSNREKKRYNKYFKKKIRDRLKYFLSIDNLSNRYTIYKTVMENQIDLHEMIAALEQLELFASTAFKDEEIEALETIGASLKKLVVNAEEKEFYESNNKVFKEVLEYYDIDIKNYMDVHLLVEKEILKKYNLDIRVADRVICYVMIFNTAINNICSILRNV